MDTIIKMNASTIALLAFMAFNIFRLIPIQIR